MVAEQPHPGALIMALAAGVPDTADAAFVAPGAVIAGPVRLARGASVWFRCVLRSESEPILVGEDCNVQDGAVVHTDVGFPTTLGDGVTVGHGAIVHGAIVEPGCLIGMGAVLLNGARVGAGSIVAAGAVVRPGAEIPERSLVAGVPAVVRGAVMDDDVAATEGNARSYAAKAAMYRRTRSS